MMDTQVKETRLIEVAKDVLRSEAKAIELAANRLEESVLNKAVELILNHHPGKIIVAGVGKSGHVAQKIAATFCSTGTRAVYLHPTEAVHGDLGIYCPGDPSILISKSGATEELMRLIPILKDFASPIIALVGNCNSPIAQAADIVIDASVACEADPLSVVPTTSAILAMSLGDALASALMVARGFEENDFARYHPAGQLGRNLLTQVGDVMHGKGSMAIVGPEASFKEVVINMTEYSLGAAIVQGDQGEFQGIITDGDIRRFLEKDLDFKEAKAKAIMTVDPVSIREGDLLGEAIRLMEDRVNRLSVLPVLDDSGNRCIGLLRIHDAYQPSQ